MKLTDTNFLRSSTTFRSVLQPINLQLIYPKQRIKPVRNKTFPNLHLLPEIYEKGRKFTHLFK